MRVRVEIPIHATDVDCSAPCSPHRGQLKSCGTRAVTEGAGWRYDTLLILLGAFLAAWLLGWVLHLGSGVAYALLLAVGVFSVARLPWRRTR